jgi:hypothetical protein
MMFPILKELRRMAGEVKSLQSLRGTLEDLNNTAHSAAQQFRANAGDLLETLKLVKSFGKEIQQVNAELRALFGAETNGNPTDPGAS